MRVSAEPVSSFFASRAAAEISAPVSQMSVLRELSHSAISVSRGPSSVQCSCHIKIREGRKPPLYPPQHINPPESCSGTILVHVQSLFEQVILVHGGGAGSALGWYRPSVGVSRRLGSGSGRLSLLAFYFIQEARDHLISATESCDRNGTTTPPASWVLFKRFCIFILSGYSINYPQGVNTKTSKGLLHRLFIPFVRM